QRSAAQCKPTGRSRFARCGAAVGPSMPRPDTTVAAIARDCRDGGSAADGRGRANDVVAPGFGARSNGGVAQRCGRSQTGGPSRGAGRTSASRPSEGPVDDSRDRGEPRRRRNEQSSRAGSLRLEVGNRGPADGPDKRVPCSAWSFSSLDPGPRQSDLAEFLQVDVSITRGGSQRSVAQQIGNQLEADPAAMRPSRPGVTQDVGTRGLNPARGESAAYALAD